MRIAVHGKEFTRQFAPFILRIFELLQGHEILVSAKFHGFLKNPILKKLEASLFEPGFDFSGVDFVISIGGDGTLLESVSYVGRSQVPILGINTGRLGFLATISRGEMESALSQVLQRKFTLDPRTLLRFESNRNIFGALNFALNDCTIVKKDSSSMITIHTYIDNVFLNSYWADGIIVATPTGSTGYSLSCGGPLIFPRSGNFAITPVSPHTLTVRPIIVSDSSEVTFRVEGRSKKFLISLDSRMATIDSSTEIKVKKADFVANLIQLEGHHYFKTLREKLNWGLDVRN